MEKLCGIVEGIIYENPANGYTVCDVSSEGKLYTLTGCMPGLSEGERLEAYGEWKNHPEYGEQFNVRMFERMMPQSEDEIEMYLGSGILPYVGKSTARKIVEKFGKDALDVIELDPDRLIEIKGITKAKATEIYKRFVEQIGLKKIVVFFQKYGVSPNLAIKAYRTFGENIVALVRENPFVLTAIDGFTFKTCDQIAQHMEIPKNFLPRIYAGLKSILMNSAYLNGHTFLPKTMLVGQAKMFLEVENEQIEDAVSVLAMQGDVVIERMDEFDAVYLRLFYDAERSVALRLREMSGMIYEVERTCLDEMISVAEGESEIILADAQRTAIDAAMRNTATVITGGPGTGKTTIINTIIRIMEAQGKKIALAAPTGRAAKRMTEVTGVEAKTIHRLLENMPGSDGAQVCFAKNEQNKLDCDILIVDEMSMVDILLMHHLLLALPQKTRLIMVGDADQLPAVGAGNVLRDIIESDSIECIKLTEIFRQAKESMIVVNAHRINKGNMPYCNDADNDFFMVNCQDVDCLCETIADLCETRIPKAYGVDSISQIQVLTPTRKSQIGVQNLNEILQKRLNPPKLKGAEKMSGGCVFRVGDKVMQNKNNYNLEWTRGDSEKGMGVFNGDVGFVTDINYLAKNMTVTYDDEKAVKYEFDFLEELELAYAVTVHKSQGSEFDVVIMPMFDTHRLLMTRNLLYTAITRAKKLVILVGKEEILKKFVSNDNIQPRYSGLKEKMVIR
ncbi:MAG: ATP-dependent RecD-like DNA helicase [Clostridia bacterium]|nr:ATP-dependent RecD-like DNA helicase [Clostridia bacterium]